MFADLLASPGVREELDLAAPIGVMALHGGLEAGTDDVAARVAAMSGASRYAVIQPDDLRWHIPSVRCDPAESSRLARFMAHVRTAISFHGYGRRGLERTVLLGGRNRALAARLGAAIAPIDGLEVVVDLDAIPAGLRGLHPANPVNLPVQHGVQVELPSGARAPHHLDAIAAAVGDVVVGALSEPM